MWGVEVLRGSAPQRSTPDSCSEELSQAMKSISLGDFMARWSSAKDSHSAAVYGVRIIAWEDVLIYLEQWLKLRSKSSVWCRGRLHSVFVESHLIAKFWPSHWRTRVGWGYRDICIFTRCSNGVVIDLLIVDSGEGFVTFLQGVLLVMMWDGFGESPYVNRDTRW